MRVTAHAYWLPKAGNRKEEYEDAFWPTRGVNREGDRFRFALADGATETSFSGLWARQLVRCFGATQMDETDLEAALQAEQGRWLQEVRSKPLPWYAEEKAQSGAFAAFLGVVFQARGNACDTDNDEYRDVSNRHSPLATRSFPTRRGDAPKMGGTATWQALAVGDCCLMQVRNNGLLRAFPVETAVSFGNQPHLLSSHPARNGALREHLATATGDCAAGDTFYLMTDALAHWFLCEVERQAAPWRALAALHSPNQPPRSSSRGSTACARPGHCAMTT